MKKMVKKTAAVVIAAALVSGTAPVNYSAPGRAGTSITASAADQIGIGTVFLIGEVVNGGESYFVINDRETNRERIKDVELSKKKMKYLAASGQWALDNSQKIKLTGEDAKPDGIIVTGGSGSYDDPFTLALYYKTINVVSFDANGGTGSMDDVTLGTDSDIFEFPECGFTPPENSVFDHWELDGKSYQVGGRVTVDGAATAVAVWRALPVISFYADGGSGSMDDCVLSDGVTEYELPPCGFDAPDNCVFAGWSVGNDLYQPGDEITVAGDVAVTALWRSLPVISFYSNGGSGSMDDYVLPNGVTEYKLPECGFDAEAGYVFACWSIDNSPYQPGVIITVTESVDVYAEWRELPAVYFYSNGGEGEMQDVTLSFEENSYELPQCGYTAPEGYEFAGWSINEGVYQPGDFITVTEPITVFAEWKALPVVYFSNNGGEGEIDPVTLAPGEETYTLPECTFTAPYGSVFDHWSVGEAGFAPGDEIPVSESLTVYAEWRALPVVYFDCNGGDGDMQEVMLAADDTSYKLPKCSFIAPDGYVFDHWSVDGEEYAPGDEIPVSESLTVYAEWRALPVVYIYSNSDDDTVKITLPDGQNSYVLPQCGFTVPEGHAFDGWWANGETYEPGMSITVDGTVEVYAVWRELPVIYFDSNGGEGEIDPVTLSADEETYKLPDCTFTAPDGYSFIGWSVDNVMYNEGAEIEVDSSVVVYAVWGVNSVISFYSNGGTGNMEAVVPAAGTEEYTLPSCSFTPPENHVFACWSVDGTEYAPGDEISIRGTVSVIAEWRELAAVMFDPGDKGTGTMDTEVLGDGEFEYTLPGCGFSAPEGYRFSYWYIEDYGVCFPGDIIDVDCITEIKAVWEQISLVKFDARGGSGTMDDIECQIGMYTVPECTFTPPARMVFDTWQVRNLDAEEEQYIDFAPGVVVYLDGRTTVFRAKWKQLPAVSFAAGIGTGSMPDIEMNSFREDVTLPECTFEAPDGYAFDYWYCDAYGSKRPGETITVDRNVTFKAQWKMLSVFRFEGNGGAGEMDEVVLPMFADFEFPECGFTAPSRTKFNRWVIPDAAEEGRYWYYNPGDVIRTSGGITVMYPEWIGLATVVFDPGEGSGSMEAVELDDSEGAFTLPECSFTPPEAKYFISWEFNGWDKFVPGDAMFYSSGENKVTALWKELPRICFDPNGGTGSMEDMILPTDPGTCNLPECGYTAPEGYVFGGWYYKDWNYSVGDPIKASSGTTTYTAIWKKVNVITFDAGAGGTGTMDSVTFYGDDSSYRLPGCAFAAPAGKLFDKWEVTDGANTAYYAPGETIAVNSSLTVRAVYKHDGPTLSFMHNCEFNNNIAMYYAIPKSELAGYENIRLAVDKEEYAAGEAAPTVRHTVLTKYTETTVNGVEVYMFVYKGITATDMSCGLSAVVNADMNGKTYYSNCDEFSIKEYAHNRLRKSSSDKYKRLLVDMLNYGAAAQINFNKNTSDLANKDLTAEQKALGTKDEPVLTSCVETEPLQNAAASFNGKNLVFDNNIILMYRMAFPKGYDMKNVKLVLSYSTSKGDQVTKTINASKFVKDTDNEGYYIAYFDSLAVTDFRSVITAKIYDGKKVISDTLKYSVESYVFNRLQASNSETFRALIVEMMKYGISAEQYFSATNS